MTQWFINKVACNVLNLLLYKTPLVTKEDAGLITGVLANKSRPAYYVYWDEKDGCFKPGIKKQEGVT